MNIAEDRLYLWLNRDDAAFQGAQAFHPMLERLNSSFLPRPMLLRVGSRAERAVTGYLDPKVFKGLDKRKSEVFLSNPHERLDISILQFTEGTAIGIFFPLNSTSSAEDIRSLFLDLVQIIVPTYARCHLDRLGSLLHENNYQAHRRTFYASGLYWLNFFGPEEEERQGGDAMADNPYAHVERLPQGLFIEVGNGPLDAATTEGEQLLVAATGALPPIMRDRSTDQSSSEEKQAMADLSIIDGVSGYFEPEDQSFWVTKNISGSSKLEAGNIAKLKGLVRKGTPPIKQVNLLFSLKEAAEKNLVALEEAGINAWYVDLETGEPKIAKRES